MILDIDVGNSSVKWRLRGSNGAEQSGRFGHDEVTAGLTRLNSARLAKIRVCSVVASVTEIIRGWGEANGKEVRVAAVKDGAGGIRCGYRDPARLGIDRWLAMLAARQRCQAAILVIDAGTALTADLVDADGFHLGGYIVPGLAAMTKALGDHTWGVRVDRAASASVDPGRATEEAVNHGCLLAALGLVEALLARHGVGSVFLTGGDAEPLARVLRLGDNRQGLEIIVAPNLVLDGLSVAID